MEEDDKYLFNPKMLRRNPDRFTIMREKINEKINEKIKDENDFCNIYIFTNHNRDMKTYEGILNEKIEFIEDNKIKFNLITEKKDTIVINLDSIVAFQHNFDLESVYNEKIDKILRDTFNDKPSEILQKLWDTKKDDGDYEEFRIPKQTLTTVLEMDICKFLKK